MSCANFAAKHRTFLAKIDSEVEPCSFSEAMKDERWRVAMRAEIAALENNGCIKFDGCIKSSTNPMGPWNDIKHDL